MLPRALSGERGGLPYVWNLCWSRRPAAYLATFSVNDRDVGICKSCASPLYAHTCIQMPLHLRLVQLYSCVRVAHRHACIFPILQKLPAVSQHLQGRQSHEATAVHTLYHMRVHLTHLSKLLEVPLRCQRRHPLRHAVHPAPFCVRSIIFP